MAKIKNPLTVVASGAPDLMVRFYDYDGTLLSGTKIKSISELPTPPVHDGLTFLRWSRTLDAIKASEDDVYVYGVYKPTDGKSRVRLSFTNNTLATTLWFSQTKSEGLEIDWGDGSEAERVTGEGTVSVLHTYAARGSYTITLTPDEDCEWSPGSGTTTSNNSFVSNTARAAVTSVEIGDNVTTFPQYCFYGFSGMTSILMPSELEQTSIDSSAFCNCSSLQSIIIPDGVTSIGNYAFYNCSSLQSIIIPDGVTSIGYDAFYNSGLISIRISDSVGVYNWSNSHSVFFQCYNLRTATTSDKNGNIKLENVRSIKAHMFRSSPLQSIDIPDSVMSIGAGAFSGCSSLTSVVIPDSVASIGAGAFSGCSSLTSIDIPDSVMSIDGSAFSGCSSLTSVIIPKGVGYFNSQVFKNCSSVSSFILGGVSHPVTTIYGDTFSGCTQSCPITIYTMPQYVTTLINNTRNGAINATIIIKAASDTVYEGVAYAAGETMVTSNPTV